MKRFLSGLLLVALAAILPASAQVVVNPYASVTGAKRLCQGEVECLTIDGTQPEGSVYILDTGTPANNQNNVKLNGFTFNDSTLSAITGSNVLQSAVTTKNVHWGVTPNVRSTPQNQQVQTQTFDNASWTKNNVTVTANSTTAPDGTSTADTLVETASGAISRELTSGIVPVTNTIYNVSIYAKVTGAGSTRYLQFTGMALGANSELPNFDIVNCTVDIPGTSVALKSATTKAIGNGWCHCSAVVQSGNTTGIIFALADDGATNVSDAYAGDGTSGLFIWGAQTSVGPFQHPYHATVASAWYGVPQGYDVANTKYGIQIEPAATNLAFQSEAFGTTPWSTVGGGLTSIADGQTAPDATTTADLFTEDTAASAGHHVYDLALVTSSSTIYTVSAYAKAGTRNFVYLKFGINNHCFAAVFNLSNGTLGETKVGATSGTIDNTKIINVGSGWYRISVSGSITQANGDFTLGGAGAASGNTFTTICDPTYTGTSSTWSLWGAQAELGSAATSYVPSVTGNGTRVVDDVTLATSATPFQQNPGTMYVDVRQVAISASGDILASFNDGSNNDIVQLLLNAPEPSFYIETGNSFQGQGDLGTASTNRMQMSVAWNTNDVDGSMDGGAAVTDGSYTAPTTINSLRLGSNTGPTLSMNGFIYQFAYAPRQVETDNNNIETWRYNF